MFNFVQSVVKKVAFAIKERTLKQNMVRSDVWIIFGPKLLSLLLVVHSMKNFWV